MHGASRRSTAASLGVRARLPSAGLPALRAPPRAATLARRRTPANLASAAAAAPRAAAHQTPAARCFGTARRHLGSAAEATAAVTPDDGVAASGEPASAVGVLVTDDCAQVLLYRYYKTTKASSIYL